MTPVISCLDAFGDFTTLSISSVPTTQACHAFVLDTLLMSPHQMKCHRHDRDTLAKTSQHYKADKCVPMQKPFHSCFPAANVHCLDEWYSTDTLIANIPATDDGVPGHGGCTMLQVYSGLDSELLYGQPLSSESELPDTLHDFIREYGTMEGLMSDNAKSKTSFTMKDIFHMYSIEDCQSEPHDQHQNPIEHQIQDIKCIMHGIMDHVGCPTPYWLLCCLYVIGLLNVLVNSKGLIPLTVVNGTVTDVSPYLDFHFWQEVFVEVPGGGEQLARWCGPSHYQGDFLTYHVLLDETKQLVT